MPGKYIKLGISTLGALGFGLAAAAIAFPDNFAALFNPYAGTGVARPAPSIAATAENDNIDIPDTRQALDIAIEQLRKAEEMQANEAAAVLREVKGLNPAPASPAEDDDIPAEKPETK